MSQPAMNLDEHQVRHLMFKAIEDENDDVLLEASEAFLGAMKNKKVTFVGNGPSLRLEQLDLMDGPTIACNRIHLLYEQTAWRPDIYVYTDRYASPNWRNELDAHLMAGYPCFVRADIAYALTRWWSYSNLKVIGECHLRPVGNNLPKSVTEPWEAGHGWHHSQQGSICSYGGALNAAAQLAWQLGFKELHLIGCDGVYVADADNHSELMPNYADTSQGERYDERITNYVNHRQSYVHELIAKELPKRGMKLVKHD